MEHFEYCMIYFHGLDGLIHVYPKTDLSQEDGGLDTVCMIVNKLALEGWRVVSQAATKDKLVWTLEYKSIIPVKYISDECKERKERKDKTFFLSRMK